MLVLALVGFSVFLTAYVIKKTNILQVRLTIGDIPAATCVVGSIHIDTNEGVDTNCTTGADNSLCLCTAANTWTALENN